jgi:primary-amine oxidase
MSALDVATHPLDPLTVAEVRAASAVIRGDPRFAAVGHVRFVSIEPEDPDKDAPPSDAERRVRAVLLDRAAGTTIQVILSLTRGSVEIWETVPGAQGAIMVSEIEEAEQAVREDPRFLAAIRRRGIDDIDKVQIDPWPPGNFGFDHERGLRLSRVVAFARDHLYDNGYAHPIEGLVALVDLNRMEVLQVDDHEVVPIPPEPGMFDASAVQSYRDDLKPLEIVQPHGPSFTVDGHEVTWQRWRLRVGFNGREGLVLYRLEYHDADRWRPILHRASISEMTVPYGDPSPTHFFKSVFDAGENGIGIAATSLQRGCDCLGEIYYFDAVICDRHGEPVPIPHAICMHEEDYGVLWRHIDWRHGKGEVRRSRRLVISSFSTIGNYDYGFFWYLYQDGTIELEVKLTGVLSTGAVRPGEQPAYGELIAPGLNGMVHQHFFNARLDFDIDGRANAVEEIEAEAVPPGPGNPHGNAFVTTRRRLRTELEAQRDTAPQTARAWEIINTTHTNRLGRPVAYRLIPGENARALAQPDSPIAKRAAFITHHLWVTPYRHDERFAAGEYPNQHEGGAGLPEWTAADRSIDGTDLVVWYTFGHHHIPRPEDWPIMPMAYIGFKMKPVGFFDRNPALDVPPPTDHCVGD